MLDSMCAHLLRAVHLRARVLRPATGKALIDALKQRPHAVLVTEPDVLKMFKSPSPHAALFDYTRFGGTLVICGTFSNNAEPPMMKKFFEGWGLSWALGDYLRTNFTLAREFSDIHGLATQYNVKAQLMHSPPEARVYVPAAGAQSQSHVFAPQAVDDTESPVVRSACGSGTVAFVGDVNAEDESTPIVLWLAGLALDDPPKAPVQGFATFDIRYPANETCSVAIGRGGAPFVWHLLAAGPGQETRSLLALSTPSSKEDTGGVAAFSTPLTDRHALWTELARAGMVDRGHSMTLVRGAVVSEIMEVLVPARERARWCAGCAQWERKGGRRFLGCSGCKSRFYCTPEVSRLVPSREPLTTCAVPEARLARVPQVRVWAAERRRRGGGGNDTSEHGVTHPLISLLLSRASLLISLVPVPLGSELQCACTPVSILSSTHPHTYFSTITASLQ